MLNKRQRKELLEELKREDYRKYADRIKVILLLDQGQTYKNIAFFLFLDESTISNYKNRYEEGGLEGLILDNYCTKRTKLSDSEEQALTKELESKIFQSTKKVIAHIEEKYKTTYSVSGCNNLLHRLGFSFKKAKGVPGKAKKKEQDLFIKEYNALKDDGKVYFGDATHPLHNTVLSYGWIKKGQDKDVLTNSGRSRVNIFGAISIVEKDVVVRSYERINQSSVCHFLKALRKKNPDKNLVLILDRGPSNTASSVLNLGIKLNIKIVFLPSYSPNLNPIERLWKFFKKQVLYNKYYEKFKDFKAACLTFFRGIRKYKKELSTLITDNFRAVGT